MENSAHMPGKISGVWRMVVRESTSDPRFADSKETQKFYEAIKAVYGPTHHTIHAVKSKDGNTMIKDRQEILSRWAEHLSELLNCINQTYPMLLEHIPQFPTHSWSWCYPFIPWSDCGSKETEEQQNYRSWRYSCWGSEVLTNGGHYLLNRLHCFILCAWTSRQLPQQWKDANFITIYKRKGDRAVCGNSRGISLLSVVGKVLLARVMLRRLLTHCCGVSSACMAVHHTFSQFFKNFMMV